MKKKILVLFLCICLFCTTMPVYAKEEATEIEQSDKEDIVVPGNIGGYSTGIRHTVNDVVEQYKFYKGKTGHGFAAERGNNLIDTLKGKNATIVGDNNIKNGADRKIINRDGSTTLIQDKYYTDVDKGIQACFEEGKFRYIDADGNPMQIEVPSDQYEEAVELMAKKIEEGKIPGITDPKEAETLVRKGNLSIQQAKNLAKSGTIESLKYDATNGIISASCAFGISAVINYAVLRVNGVDRVDAIKESAIEGVKTGGIVFATEVIVGQLVKVKGFNLFVPTSEALVKALGKDFANNIVTVTAKGGAVVGKNAMTYAAKVLRTQALTSGVTVIILSIEDVCDIFTGRISEEQLIKNLAVTTAGVAGGYVGWYLGAGLGSMVAPGAGTVVGGVGGSAAAGGLAGFAAEKVLGLVIKDDADKMVKIIQTDFQQMASDYLINQEEAEIITAKLSEELTGDTLKEMFKSDDREAFAEELLEPLFTEKVAERATIDVPSEEEMRSELVSSLDGVVFVH